MFSEQQAVQATQNEEEEDPVAKARSLKKASTIANATALSNCKFNFVVIDPDSDADALNETFGNVGGTAPGTRSKKMVIRFQDLDGSLCEPPERPRDKHVRFDQNNCCKFGRAQPSPNPRMISMSVFPRQALPTRMCFFPRRSRRPLGARAEERRRKIRTLTRLPHHRGTQPSNHPATQSPSHPATQSPIHPFTQSASRPTTQLDVDLTFANLRKN